jgi:hypothetical protein
MEFQNSLGIPIEFYVIFHGIPNKSREFQRIPKSIAFLEENIG